MTDYRKRLEDACDCSGATREDDELVLVTVGDLSALLSEGERMREALAAFDASYAECPFSPASQAKRNPESGRGACSLCGATPRDSCGRFGRAATVFINTARQALGDPDQ